MTLTTPPPEPTNVLVDLLDIIAAPGQALRRISFHPRSWWFPALLSLLSAILLLWVNLDYLLVIGQKLAQIQLSNQNLTPEQLETAQTAMERFMQPNFMLIQGAIGILLGLLLAWVLSTLLIFLSASIGGANPKATSMWALILWTWIPFVIRNLVYSAFGMFTDAFVRSPGLSYFIATGDLAKDQTNPIYVAATQVDIFSLWHLILIYVLLRAAIGMGKGGAIAVAILYALVNVGLRVGASQLPALFGAS
ncbi:MAG TPA: hypothetical protein G4N94_05030 [Caldilineae bacterium]|nr:hypothetical protein [Caldilineae bacterium]